MSIAFVKMHGLGNDFVVVDGITQRIELSAARIAELADRHTGIGFDQLLIVQTPDDPDADFRYRIHNADGSEAEQCGNGARCFARFVRDRQLTRKHRIVMQTNTGTIVATVHGDRVDVDMGEPVFDLPRIPFEAGAAADATPVDDTAAWRQTLRLDDDLGDVELVPVNMGNPHAVVFVEDVASADVAGIGAAVQRHAAFPESVNVGFLQVVDAGFARLRVFERGIGETRACGSGACAAVAAAVSRGRIGSRCKVSLPGGKLRIEWQGAGHAIRMSGPADVAFEGHFEA